MGELNTSPGRVVLLLLLGLALVCTGSCQSSSSSSKRNGYWYTVQKGDTLYNIGKRHAVSPEELTRVNRIRDVRQLSVGTRIWVPKTKLSAKQRKRKVVRISRTELRQRARKEAKRSADLSFRWPLKRAKLTSGFGRRSGRRHEGIDLASPSGTKIRAAEGGKVIHVGWLGDYGKVVILKHSGDYRTVYAHARKLLVKKGRFVERGDKIAEVGSTGRSTGPHLHFEIRRRNAPKDPLLYLPKRKK
jgi:murein DD-endopeptidase MepM/ murein hydrolase activator NlpD